jgi:nucleoside-diphosphate-sugar epimerase
MKRDFTYVDDIVEAIIRMQDVIPQADPNWTVESGFGHQFSALSYLQHRQ